MAKFTVFADVVDGDFQNVQEWTTIWGDVREDVQRLGGEILDAYAVLGGHDFQITYEAADEEAAIRIAVAIERYGLDTDTHQLVSVDRLGELVDDI